jgi:hypothetical protein
VVNLPQYRYLDERVQAYLIVGIVALLAVENFSLATVPPASEFETSLVAAYPLAHWIAFYAVIALGVVVFVASAQTGTGYWRHALVLVLCNYAIYFFLPAARGYRLYGRGASDILRHLGDVKGIINTGTLPGIWYPAEHVFLSEFVMAGVPIDRVMYPVAFLFTALYILSVGVLVRLLSDRTMGLALGVCAATPLVYTELHLTIIPSTLSFFLFPVVLFVVEQYRRTDANVYLALFGVFALLIVFFHPMTSIFLVVLLLAFSAFASGYTRLIDATRSALSPRLALAIPPALFAWLINFQETKRKIADVYTSYAVEASQTTPVEAQTAEGAVLTPVQIALRATQVYGALALYVGIAGLFCLYLLYRFVRRRRLSFAEGLFATQFGVGFSIAAVVMTGFLVVGEPYRVSRYMLLMATVLVGMLLVRQLERNGKLVPAVLATCIIAAGVLGANAAYEPNEHLTDAEYRGTSFMVTHQNGDHSVQTYKMWHKMEEYVLGSDHPALYPETITRGLLPGLGYGANETAAQTYGDSYVVTKEYDLKFYQARYFNEAQREEQFYYGPEDAARLRHDRSASKIYANGGFTAWRTAPDRLYQPPDSTDAAGDGGEPGRDGSEFGAGSGESDSEFDLNESDAVLDSGGIGSSGDATGNETGVDTTGDGSELDAAGDGSQSTSTGDDAEPSSTDDGTESNSTDDGTESNSTDDGTEPNSTEDDAESNSTDDGTESNSTDDGIELNFTEDGTELGSDSEVGSVDSTPV